jgi:uncharacterized protein (DUF433 family)
MSLAPQYIDIGTFIDQQEGYRGGRPFIVGTGVTVDSIAVHHRIHGMGPEELSGEFGLTMPQVMAALAFYLANEAAIDHELDRERRAFDAEAEEHRAKHGSVWERLKARAER